MLREPFTLLAGKCALAWGDRDRLNAVLMHGFSGCRIVTNYVVDIQ
jgi:hypothetical protein